MATSGRFGGRWPQNDLERLDFGYFDASKEDPKCLHELFVETKQFKAFRHRDSRFILGRKGFGKTALERTLADLGNDEYRAVLRINANQFELPALVKVHRNLASQVGGIVELRRTWANQWEHAILLSVMEQAASLEKGDDAETLRRYLRTFSDEQKSSTFQYVVKGLEAISETIPTVGKTASELIRFVAEFPVHQAAYIEAKSALARVLAQEGPVLVTFDGIDTYFDVENEHLEFDLETKRAESEAVRVVLTGLVQAVYNLSVDLPLRDHLDFKVFFPEDKFNEIRTRDLDKIRQFVHEIEWDEAELRQFIALRIAHSLNIRDAKGALQTDNASTWHRVFPRTISDPGMGNHREEVFDYLLRHSRHAPRDLQIYCTAVKQLAQSVGASEITEDIVRKVVARKSTEVADIVFLEYGYEYPYLRALVESFREARPIMSYRDEFFPILKRFATPRSLDPAPLVKLLYRVGFIGVVETRANAAPERASRRFVKGKTYALIFRHHEPRYEVSRATTIMIHPVFGEFLGLEPAGSTFDGQA